MSTVGVRLSDRAEDNLRSVRLTAMRNNIQSEIFNFTINNGDSPLTLFLRYLVINYDELFFLRQKSSVLIVQIL